jgi:hypothetical protein
MFDAGWLNAPGSAFAAKVAMVCGKWEVIQFSATRLGLNFHDMDPLFSDRSVVFSLAGYFADMAADAKVVMYEQAIL